MSRRRSSSWQIGRGAALGTALVALLWLGACSRSAPAAAPQAPAPTAARADAAPPAAQGSGAVADFYRGKTVRLIVGFGPGGGFDTYSRAIGRHLGRFIPGSPTVVVENMPGAGSMLAANHLYNVAPKDGTVIGNIHGNLFMQQLFESEGVRFDATRFGYLGVPAVDNILCVAPSRTGFKSIKDAQNPNGRPLVLGGSAFGSTTDDDAVVLKEALDLNLKLVQGYDGTAKIRLAMEQGELDGLCGWSWESIKTSNYDQIASGEYVVLVQATERPLPDLPQRDAPLAYDLVRSADGRDLIRAAIVTPSRTTRPYLLPPGVPPERLAALRSAFQETLRDPQFLADAQKAQLDVDLVPAEEVEQLVRDQLAMAPGLKARLKDLLVPK
jgi:tripartite-type tricarboxylate transporter receptor subunit TctC